MRITGDPAAGAELVSVVIPVRDGERYLGEAIESAVRQSPAPLEVLVVDDGSRDATSDVARSFGAPVRCVAQPPLGVSAALNRGVELARGGLLAFLDADDLWVSDKLALQLAALQEGTHLDGVFGQLANFDHTGAARETFPGYSKGTLLIRREAFARVGPFTDWRLGEFLEWYARAIDAGLQFLMLPEVVLRRRVHDTNTGVRLRRERVEYTRVLKAVLDRRRALEP
jgi:glycosyltransferase involved in cell wall biosynthesis